MINLNRRIACAQLGQASPPAVAPPAPGTVGTFVAGATRTLGVPLIAAVATKTTGSLFVGTAGGVVAGLLLDGIVASVATAAERAVRGATTPGRA